MNMDFPTQKIGSFDTELGAFSVQDHLRRTRGITLHLDALTRDQPHHIAAAAFGHGGYARRWSPGRG